MLVNSIHSKKKFCLNSKKDFQKAICVLLKEIRLYTLFLHFFFLRFLEFKFVFVLKRYQRSCVFWNFCICSYNVCKLFQLDLRINMFGNDSFRRTLHWIEKGTKRNKTKRTKHKHPTHNLLKIYRLLTIDMAYIRRLSRNCWCRLLPNCNTSFTCIQLFYERVLFIVQCVCVCFYIHWFRWPVVWEIVFQYHSVIFFILIFF